MNPDDPLGLIGTKPQSNDPLGLLSAPHLPTKLELAKRNASTPHPEDLEEDDPSYAQQALGGIASLAHDIPGAEAAQAGARSLVRGQSYTDALSDIRGAENSASPWVRHGNNIVGGTIAAAATPGSNVALQGARFGIAEALGGADPENLKERIDKIPARATIDALAGKLFGEVVPNAVRTVAAKSLGKNVLERTGAMEAADAVNYGKAAREGSLAAANPTPQAVTDALNDADIKPYVAIIRGSRLFQHADDPTVLREAYKLMTERQKTLGSRIINSDDFKAGSELENAEISSAKRRLLDASGAPGSQTIPAKIVAVPPVTTAQSPTPSLREALEKHQSRIAEAARRTNPSETVSQRSARESLERHGAESVVSPRLRGSASDRPVSVELSPSETVTTPPVMPSFREAVYEHAAAQRELDALKSGADATGRIVRGADVSGKKLAQNSPEAFLKSILTMRESQAKAATEGVLGKLRAKSALSFNPLKGFGIPKTVSNVNKMSPYLSALDQQAGNDVLPPFLRHAGIALGESGN